MGLAGSAPPRPPPQPRSRRSRPLVPERRRSPRAVARRGVQGALWPSGAGGRSSQGDAGGSAEAPRLRHRGRPAAAWRPRPRSAERLRCPRGCGGPGARCGSAGAGPQQQRRPQPPQEWEAARRRRGSAGFPPLEAAGSGTTPPGYAEATAAAARGECARRVPGSPASASGDGRGGNPLAGRRGVRPLRQPPRHPSPAAGASAFLPAPPRRLEAREGRLGPAPPRSPGPAWVPAPPGVEQGLAGARAPLGWAPRGAQPLVPTLPVRPPRRAEDACLPTASAFPRPPHRVPQRRGVGG